MIKFLKRLIRENESGVFHLTSNILYFKKFYEG